MSPALSFSGSTSQGPFWIKILEGHKVQTCRLPRKKPIKQGDRLILYWKQRVPEYRKPIHKIGEAICTKVERLRYGEFAYDEEFAKRDGFRDSNELQKWFGNPVVYKNEEYDVIYFKLRKEYDVIYFQT